MPNGWRVSHQGHYVYLLPPSGANSCSSTRATIPSPTRSRTGSSRRPTGRAPIPATTGSAWRPVRYPQAEKAADWEFTYYRQGVLTHVLNRNILANAHHAYALYWSTPDSQWGQDWHIFKVLARDIPARVAIAEAARNRAPGLLR